MSEVCRVLIIDDNPDDRAEMRQMLLFGSNRRYLFSEAVLGRQALDLVRQQLAHQPLQAPFDCIVLDLNLPDMDAHHWLESFCQGRDLPPCPVVVITGWPAADNRTGPRLLRAGAQDYIGKSWAAADSLTRAVDNAIERYGLLASQKAAQASLRQSEGRYRSLFDAMEDCLCVYERLDPPASAHVDFRCVDVNPAFVAQSALAGMPGGIGSTLTQQLPDDADTWIGICTLVHTTGVPLRFEHRVSAPARVLSVCAFRMGEIGQHKVTLALSDITARKAAEARLEEQALVLADQHRRKDEFLAMLSHELRSPLAPLANAVRLLQLQHDDCAARRQAIAIVERQVGQLRLLVGDLLDVSRITTGLVQLRRETIDAGSIVAKAVETTQVLLDERGHTLAVTLSQQPVWLHADSARLEQVVVNLLTNAAKYTNPGGHIAVGVELDGDSALLRVRDDGIGMAQELLPRIFELFTQADRSLDRSQGGLGIGLNLAQRLVHLHDGSISVSSVLGEGSEFVVRLPAVAGPARLSSKAATSSADASAGVAPGTVPAAVHLAAADADRHAGLDAGANPGGDVGDGPLQPVTHSRKVLVVDDNIDSADSLAMLLDVHGHVVRTAHDGPAALAAAQAFRPDVVLLDIGLPLLDGYQVARRMRQSAGLEHVVLVAMTGYGHHSDKLDATRAGFDHHLVKPANFQDVQAIVLATASLSAGVQLNS